MIASLDIDGQRILQFDWTRVHFSQSFKKSLFLFRIQVIFHSELLLMWS